MNKLYRIAGGAVIAAAIAGAAIPALAQTSTTSASALIATLQQQIVALQAQLEALRAAQSAVKTAASDIKETLKLLRELREGMTGEEVRLLQTILAADSSVYPEGKITGFYGTLTAQAVKRFQKKHGLDTPGNVGPKTLAKLNDELKKHPLAEEEDEDDDDGDGKKKRPCAIVPPGHLIAPGWLRKHDGQKPIVPPCQKLPEGIEKKLGSGTTTPDTTAPTISAVMTADLTTTSAKVKWTTNEAATSKVWYGTTTPVATSSNATLTVHDGALVTSHTVNLLALTPNTTYYYVVSSADAAGNTTYSAQGSFATPAVADTTAPVISSVSATDLASTSAKVIWTTNEAASSKVWYGLITPLVTTATTTLMTQDAALVTSHAVNLTGLTASTTYYYMVSSTDAASNSASSGELSFATPAP